MNTQTTSSSYRLSFLLLEQFSMIAFSNLIEPFRLANQLITNTPYHWQISGFSPDGRTTASNQLSLNHTCTPETLLDTDILIICGGYDTRHPTPKNVCQLIRRAAAHKTLLGGACTGALALADANCLDHYTATLHWENITAAQERHPNVHFRDTIFIADRDRLTCSGGTTSLDMALHLISQHHGDTISHRIAKRFMLERIRPPDTKQHTAIHLPYGTAHKHLSSAISYMHQHLNPTKPIAHIAEHTHLSERQLECLFRHHLHTTPQRYYTTLRLKRAQELLRQTHYSITHISLICGFSTASNFSKAYRSEFGETPSHYRQQQQNTLK